MKPEASAERLSDAARAEAAAWIARLHSAPITHPVREGLQRWIKADPSHARAFELATDAWEIGGAIAAENLPRITGSIPERSRASVTRKILPAAAVLFVLALGCAFYFARYDRALTTSVGEQRILTLQDGTRIFLNTDTRLTVRSNARSRRVVLIGGEASFEVTKDPRRPFIVSAGNRQVVALGTSFLVRRDSQQFSVALLKGEVRVSTTGSNATDALLRPGQRITFKGTEPPTIDEPNLDHISAWQRGELILDRTPLQEAIEELNRYSSLQLVIDDPDIRRIRVSGIFRAGDSARFARAVSETYGLATERQGQNIHIHRLPSGE
jgi:transmembrane sensor